MVPFWIAILIRRLISGVPEKGSYFGQPPMYAFKELGFQSGARKRGWETLSPTRSKTSENPNVHHVIVSLNYCSQNGGNLYRAPYYNRNLNIGPRIIGNLDQSPCGSRMNPTMGAAPRPKSSPKTQTSPGGRSSHSGCQELNLSYYIGETMLITICIYIYIYPQN